MGSGGKYIAKICDFGFAEKLKEPDSLVPFQGMRGSLGYFSPEQLRRKAYGQAVDLFALGIIIYTLLCGYEPFYPSNRAGLLTGDAEEDSKVLSFDPPYWDRVSVEGKAFIRGLLHGNACLRYTATQALQSAWIELSEAVGARSSEDADIQFE